MTQFRVYRCKVAEAYNKEFAEIYENPYTKIFYQYTKEDIKKLNLLCNDDLDLFLNHCDCSGKLSWRECKKIYKVMKNLKVEMKGHNYGTMKEYDMHELWLNMLYFCWQYKRTMYFE